MTDFCIGTAQMGLDYGVANNRGKIRIEEIDEILLYAYKNDIKYLDTAQAYGDSEKVLGESLSRVKINYDVSVITKISPNIAPFTEKTIIKSVENSLNDLNLKNLYGLLAHRPSIIGIAELLNAVESLTSDNIIDKFGVSVYTPQEALEALSHPEISILQLPFNMLDRRWVDLDIFSMAEKKGVHIFIRSIFLQGLIFMNDERLIAKGMSWAVPHMKIFRKLVYSSNYSAIELTFKLLTQKCKNATIILGIDSLGHLKENIKLSNQLKNVNIDPEMWWQGLPFFPEKLLNPSLWDISS